MCHRQRKKKRKICTGKVEYILKENSKLGKSNFSSFAFSLNNVDRFGHTHTNIPYMYLSIPIYLVPLWIWFFFLAEAHFPDTWVCMWANISELSALPIQIGYTSSPCYFSLSLARAHTLYSLCAHTQFIVWLTSTYIFPTHTHTLHVHFAPDPADSLLYTIFIFYFKDDITRYNQIFVSIFLEHSERFDWEILSMCAYVFVCDREKE